MRIAIPFEHGEINQHFGHTEQFKFYDISEGEVYNSNVITMEGSGDESIVESLYNNAVSAVICGGIGEGAIMALQLNGIMCLPGVTGNADDAIVKLIEGTLEYDDSFTCHAHDEGGGCGHDCGGCQGCH